MFIKSFEKKAAARSEILNSTLNPLNWILAPAAALSGLAGVAMGAKTKKELQKQDEKSWSNAIPLVSQYRYGRRMASTPLPKE